MEVTPLSVAHITLYFGRGHCSTGLLGQPSF